MISLRPALDEDLCCLQRVEEFTGQPFVPQRAIETLVVAALPGTPRFNGERLHVETLQPVADGVGGEFGPMVRVQRLGTRA